MGPPHCGRLFASEIMLGRIHCNTFASPAVIIGYAFWGPGPGASSPISAKIRQNYFLLLLLRRRTASSGTAPAAAKKCESSSASPRLNSIGQSSIPHDHLRQLGRPACSTHAFAPLCPEHAKSLSIQAEEHPRMGQSQIDHPLLTNFHHHRRR
jgi:hypothetical protein